VTGGIWFHDDVTSLVLLLGFFDVVLVDIYSFFSKLTVMGKS